MILSDGSMLSIHGYRPSDHRYHGVEPIILPYDPTLQQPASYDLQLGLLLASDGGPFQHYRIATHEFILGSTLEYVHIPDNMVARIEGKSSLARQGIMVHTAGFIDPGFRGQLTLEIVNHGRPFELHAGMKIAQLAIQTMDAIALYPYGHPDLGSHYQDQVGPTAAR